MNTYAQYEATRRYAEERESKKFPGQKFCDNYGWRLDQKFRIIQRPDKITRINGSIYRTHTMVFHVWCENIKCDNHHIWIEFNGDNIILKDGIKISYSKSPSGGVFLTPNPDEYCNIHYFKDEYHYPAGKKLIEFIENKY